MDVQETQDGHVMYGCLLLCNANTTEGIKMKLYNNIANRSK